jgi:DNA (cytosine-5)-methyltransferase 1
MKIRVGTDCSGIEAPIQALKKLCKKYKNFNFLHEFSSEIDEYAIQSIQSNYNPKYIFGDITKRNPKHLPDIDLYVCGFPCQPFSTAGLRKGLNDSRGNIFFHCIKTIKNKTPKYFVLENVKGILSIEKGKTFQNMLQYMQDSLPEYNIYWNVLNTKDYGIPQNRERLYIVGTKEDRIFKWPKPIRMKSLEKFIDYTDTNQESIPKSSIKLFSQIPFNSIFINIGFTQNLFVCSDKVAPCLTATSGLWCVPLHRKGNIKEHLALQGFPSNFKQVVSDSQLKKQIGNSMSVCVLEKIFENLLFRER